MRKLLFALALLISEICASQDLLPSNTYVRTCLNDIECASINSSSYLFYDDVNGKFYLKLDFNRMKTGVDSVDFWLNDLSNSLLYFKAGLPKADLPTLSSYNTKNLRLDGELFLNGIWHNQTLQMSVYRAQDDLLNNSTNADDLEVYKVNFSFSFSPKDFNVHKKPQKLTNTIFVGVGGGQLNLLKQGMEGVVGEAYRHE